MDISAAIATSLSSKLIDSLDFPMVIRVHDGRVRPDDPADDVDVTRHSGEAEGEASGEELFDAAAEGFAELLKARRNDPDIEFGEHEQMLWDALSPYWPGGDEDRVRVTKILREAVEANPDPFSKAYGELFDKGLKWTLEWAEVEISNAPTVSLGNPIRCTGLTIKVRAKVEGCIKILGKKICARITSPWIRVEGQEIRLNLVGKGTLLVGEAVFSNIDLVIKIKIAGFSYKIKIGLTSIINRQFKDKPITLFDAQALKLDVPGLGRSFKPHAVGCPPTPGSLTVGVDGQFTA